MLAIDKQAHFWWGMAMAGIVEPVAGPLSAFFLASMTALLKEVVDSRHNRSIDYYDLGAACMGALLACVWFWVVAL